MKPESVNAADLIDRFALVVGSDTFSRLCLIVAVFTVIIVGIEVIGKTKASLRACFNFNTFLYLAILFSGNVVAATVFLIPHAENAVHDNFASGYALLAGFVGVFSFQGVLSNTNITVFNKGILTIADWIGKAADNSIALSLEKDVRMKDEQAMRIASALTQLPDAELNTHITNVFGNGKVPELEADAAAVHADARYYKALKLATQHLDYARRVKKLPAPA